MLFLLHIKHHSNTARLILDFTTNVSELTVYLYIVNPLKQNIIVRNLRVLQKQSVPPSTLKQEIQCHLEEMVFSKALQLRALGR